MTPTDARAFGSPCAPGGADGLVGFLASLQLNDSAFPSGRYTLSYGLEAFVQAGIITRSSPPKELLALLGDQIRHGTAPADAAALACAHRAAPTGTVTTGTASPGSVTGTVPVELAAGLAAVGAVDARLSAVKLAREARQSSARTGRQLLTTAAAAFDSPAVTGYCAEVRAGTHPGNAAVALGLVSAVLGVPLAHAVAGELYTFASGWLAAAVRLSVTDHRVAQLVLHRLGPLLESATVTATTASVDDIRSCTPLVDVMAMRHERAELRLFSS
ncbi:urease accessory protein UreF [Aquipuribacter hungaricus]|uniref:Urease accessory protein UreF n=1 Tax=Aquipuribacter hungaricus TaxID=545624 RepID=A0ABV7WKD6_9MICO